MDTLHRLVVDLDSLLDVFVIHGYDIPRLLASVTGAPPFPPPDHKPPVTLRQARRQWRRHVTTLTLVRDPEPSS